MRKILFVLLSVLLLGGLYSCKPNDQKLQKEVETVLTSAYQGISSTVKDGVATIQGVVESDEAKAAIEKAISAVKGVKSVVNNISVKKPEPPVTINPDEVLTTTITNALSVAGYKGVNVAVADGEVTLTGDLAKSDLTKVMQIANEAKPKKVINQLNLK